MKNNKFSLFPYMIGLFLFPVVSLISLYYLNPMIWNMEDNILQNILYEIYSKSFYLSPIFCTVQFLYFMIYLITNIRKRRWKLIFLGFGLLFLSLLGLGICYMRVLAAAAGIG
ncbi:glucan phosphoethanolaminetransferase (alkaline phosphatase superfamily) [Bacillus mesophilus]|uniref:Uncharacterized protein n=1 Tax=Bacillus mesophilus TaxID=1808955 RepID=A0A6M0Q7M8_9BACI|nr:hypothetical protein [Bacillus mesophilus]MBM7661672.1 glucan phosphoethanolaminetransferase (alkaline phosphatase superfamily) [Bacillus mesophilus]NEY72334.1 hypothetical protein [Bacillus mesophilus]